LKLGDFQEIRKFPGKFQSEFPGNFRESFFQGKLRKFQGKFPEKSEKFPENSGKFWKIPCSWSKFWKFLENSGKFLEIRGKFLKIRGKISENSGICHEICRKISKKFPENFCNSRKIPSENSIGISRKFPEISRSQKSLRVSAKKSTDRKKKSWKKFPQFWIAPLPRYRKHLI
jgi:hypothetical protein